MMRNDSLKSALIAGFRRVKDPGLASIYSARTGIDGKWLVPVVVSGARINQVWWARL